MIDQYRQRFGSSLNDGMIEMLQIKKQALDQLIDRNPPAGGKKTGPAGFRCRSRRIDHEHAGV
jgi:hypothetical protein